jgi:hypothetical protein
MDKHRDFIDAQTGKPVPQLFSLTGMSGSGVWDMNLEDNEHFPSCAKALAGIIVEDHPDESLAKVVRVQQVWSSREDAQTTSLIHCRLSGRGRETWNHSPKDSPNQFGTV